MAYYWARYKYQKFSLLYLQTIEKSNLKKSYHTLRETPLKWKFSFVIVLLCNDNNWKCVGEIGVE